MKKFSVAIFFSLQLMILSGCSTLSYDPVEYDRVVGLHDTMTEIEQMCPVSNRPGITSVLVTYELQLRWLDTYSKNIDGNDDLYQIITRMQKDAKSFLEIAKQPNMTEEYCYMKAKIAKEGITRTLQAIGKRRQINAY